MPQKRWEVRRATEADLPGVHEITRQQWGPDTLAHPDYWRWLTRGSPGGPTCFWLATVDDEIIAIFTMEPVRVKVGDRQVLPFHLMNSIVRSDFRRQGVITTVGRRAIQDSGERGVPFCYAAARRDTMKGALRAMGLDVIGPAGPLMLKPLDVGAMLAYKGIKSRPIHWLASAGYKMTAPFLRRGWFNRPDADLTISEVTSFDERFDRFWERVRHKYHTLLVRDAAFLQWRYRDVPLKAARCFAATDSEGEVVAYIAFRNADLEGIAAGLILDLLVEPSERGRQAGNQLVAEAARLFRKGRSALGVCVVLRHTHEIRILRDQGYIPCPRSLEPYHLTMLCSLTTDPVDRNDVISQDRWFFTLGDWGIDAFSI